MGEEEIHKKMVFIVEELAQFASDLHRLTEVQGKDQARISNLEGAVVAVVNLASELTKAQQVIGERVAELAGKVEELSFKIGH